MTNARPPSADGGPDLIPQPSLLRLFSAAWAALALFWVPLTVLPILDGLLFLAPGLDVARDLALLLLLGLLPIALWVLLSRSAAALLQRVWPRQAALLSWSLLLLPLALICGRQAARVLWQWLRTVSGLEAQMAPGVKLVIVALSLLGVALLVWRIGPRRCVGAGVQQLMTLRAPALLLLAASLLLVALHPPQYVPLASRTAQASTAQGPDILLITLDTLAAADAEVCNPASATMPHLARFAATASCFERAYASSNFTTSSTSTMESGLLPWSHLANQPDATMRVGSRGHTLPAVLKAQGWRTHSVTDNLLASPRHRGSFAAYDTAWLSRTGLSSNLYRHAATVFPDTTLPRLAAASLAFLSDFDTRRLGADNPFRAEWVYDDVQRLLAQERAHSGPQFIWALTLPPHSPYLPPPSTRYKLLPPGELERMSDLMPDNIEYPPQQQGLVDKHRLRYRELMMAADLALGEFLQGLERSGRLDRMLVVITSDHGESFEQGFYGHAGPRVHEALIRVPLVIRLPGQREGRRIAQPVSHAALAPTLLDLVGAPPLAHAEARSFRPLLEGQPWTSEPVFAMTMEHQRRDRPLESGHFTVIDGRYKLVMALPEGQPKLFDLTTDPGALHDLAREQPAQAERLSQLIRKRLAKADAQRLQVLTPALPH